MDTSAPFLPRHGADDPVARRGDRVLTAAEFADQAGRLATSLEGATAFACLCGDRAHVALALAAALLLDVPCLLPHDRTPETLRRLRRDYPRAPLLLDSAEAVEGGVALPTLLAATARSGTRPTDLFFPETRRAALVFTSGSTGTPQAHEKRWGAFARVALHLGRRFGLGAGTSVVATVPGQHMYGLEASLMLPLHSGGLLWAGRPLFPMDVAQALAATPPPRVLVSTPFHLRAVVESGVPLPSIAFAVSATAPLDERLARRVETAFEAPLLEIYGCTEAGTVATRQLTADPRWLPCPEVDVVVTEPEADSLARAPYLPEPVPLADRLRLFDDGRFELRGRCSDMVSVAGKRGSLQYLTARLLEIPGVVDGAFFAPEDGPAGEVRRLVAFVVAPGRGAAEIRAELRQRLDAAFLPRPVLLLDALPRNSAGKLPQAALQRLCAEADEAAS